MTQTALGTGAGLVALAFCLSTFERWLARRRRHELAWTVALALFAVASGALAAGAANGWNGPIFRVFYLFGAIVNVPFLAVGSVYLLAGRRAGDRAAIAVSVFSAFADGVELAANLSHAVPRVRLPPASHGVGAHPRVHRQHEHQ